MIGCLISLAALQCKALLPTYSGSESYSGSKDAEGKKLAQNGRMVCVHSGHEVRVIWTSFDMSCGSAIPGMK